MSKIQSYELFLHGKQGDDFAHLLDEAQHDIPKALRAWAASFKENAAVCERLAKAFEGQKLSTQADVHFISFDPADDKAEACLKAMAKEELLNVSEIDDEDEIEDE